LQNLHPSNTLLSVTDVGPFWDMRLASGHKLGILEAELKRPLHDISLLVREYHTLGLWNLPSWTLLLDISEHAQQT